MQPPARTLVFVYNADGGLVGAAFDLAHKLLAPETYRCRLCALTHGAFGVHRAWRCFVDGLGVETAFLHADAFHRQHGHADVRLPAVFVQTAGELRPWIAAEEIDACRSLDELQDLIRRRLDA